MAGVEARDFDSPDETRNPDKTRIEIIRMTGTTAARFTFEPGWRWSECVKPVAGTDSCQARHVGVVRSGRLGVRHEDGSEGELRPGDASAIEPGHDARVMAGGRRLCAARGSCTRAGRQPCIDPETSFQSRPRCTACPGP